MSLDARFDAERDFSPLAAAHADRDSVLDLATRLVRIPSRGGIDSYEPVISALETWLDDRHLPHRRLAGDDGTPVAVVCEVRGARPGPRIVLDACVDTAPFGDEQAWSFPPASGLVADGWLCGRGAADSKTGAAIFLHIAARLARNPGALAGDLVVLLDADEHTGNFGGAKAFMGAQGPGRIDGVMIGYPGHEHVVIGGRGVLRACLTVHGVSSHSGGRAATPNAVSKAAALIAVLDRPLPAAPVPGFDPAPKLSVTEIHAGQGYTVTPDLASVHIDVRLTPAFTEPDALALIAARIAEVDAAWPETAPTGVETVMSWPPYRLAEHHPLPTALLKAAHDQGFHTASKVAGPSNIGNFLAGAGVAATAGFGVAYEGLHARNERIRIETIAPVQAVYHQAVLTLLS